MKFADATPETVRTPAPAPGRVLGVIPARLASSRLPRKPLHTLLGRPMVAWVWDRARTMEALHRVVVATDSEEVADACVKVGAEVALTRTDHPSGTDRVAEVATRSEFLGFDTVVNLQGDEPLMEGSHVQAAVAEVARGMEVGTCATRVTGRVEWEEPSVVKVVRRSDGAALYFSRAPIPHPRDSAPDDRALRDGPFLRHLGIYAYRRDALLRWVALEPSPLEEVEKLEQLRALEAGLTIGVAVVDRAERGVDTLEDALHVERRMRELGFGS